jgi:hypothetical protein
MSNELWLSAAVLIAIFDVIMATVWLAKFTDKSLERTGSRWRFGMTTPLIAMMLIAVNTALVMSFFRR